MNAKRVLALVTAASILCFTYYLYQQSQPKEPESLRILYINNSNSEELAYVKASMVAIESMVKTKLDLPINFEILEVKNSDEYRIKRNTIMLNKNPPDLILAGTNPLNDLAEMDLLMPLDNNISNLNKVYSALRGTHSVAFGFHIKSAVINTGLLESCNLPVPSPDWTERDVVELIDTLKTKKPGLPIYLTKSLYESYYNTYLEDCLNEKLAGDIDDFTLTDEKFLNQLTEMKTIMNRDYDLSDLPNQSARLRMVFDPKSQEYKAQTELINQRLMNSFTVAEGLNAMNAMQLSKIYFYTSNIVMLPIGDRVETLRFGISKHAPHQEEAMKFLDMALNWDSQFKFALFSEKAKFTQVNMDNEDRMMAYGDAFAADSNVIEIRQKVIKMLNDNYYTDIGEISQKEIVVRNELMQTTFNVIFDPQLNDKTKMLKELKIVEDRIKLMIKE